VPDIDLAVYPAHKSIKSVHNTIIEAFWRWLRGKLGGNLRDHILRGKTEHIFDPKVAFHWFVCLEPHLSREADSIEDLFNWIFPPLVQAELDEFRTYWNQHQVRSQPNKNMPSGHVPADVLEHPELFGGNKLLDQGPERDPGRCKGILDRRGGAKERASAMGR
jgi:hypothetical protein